MAKSETRRANLTKAHISTLTPEKDLYDVHDTKQPGLCVRVRPTGSKKFMAYLKVEGVPCRKMLGSCQAVTVEMAREATAKLIGQIAMGEKPFDDRKKRRQEMTVGELHARYIEAYCKPRKLGWKKDLLPYNKHLKKHWHNKRVSEIDAVEVHERFQAIGASAPIQANRVLSIISKMMKFAKSLGVGPEHNPAEGIDKYPENERQRYLSDDELIRLAGALDGLNNQMFADFFRLALFIGTRRGNILAMRKEQLQIWKDKRGVERGRWSIPRTKNKRPLVVHLSVEALIVLKRRLNASGDSPWVFPSPRSKTGHIVEPKNAWAEVCEKGNLEDCHIHDLRHSYASELAKKNISLLLLGQAMGHLSVQSTKRYAHLSVDDVSVVIDQANADVARKMGFYDAIAMPEIPDDVEWDDCEGGIG